MDKFQPLDITAGGRAVLQPGEVEVRMEKNTSLYDKDRKVLTDGIVTCTTHRILWVKEGSDPKRICIALSEVGGVQDKSSTVFGSAKLLLDVAGGSWFMIGFKSGGRDAFGKALRQCVSGKEWEKGMKSMDARGGNKPAVNAGIGTLLEMRRLEERNTSSVMSDGLGDLESLMVHARDMVAIAEKMKAAVMSSPAGSASLGNTSSLASTGSSVASTSGSQPKAEDSEYNALLMQAGILSPVSREVAGDDLFHSELARQLADFLKPRLDSGNGIMTLTDAYCLYNRARGIDLVSPEDLRKACQLFEAKNLPVRLQAYSSGVLVLRSAQSSAISEAHAITSLLKSKQRQGLDAPEVAQALGLSLKVAREALDKAEKSGELCRDDSLDGLRFFPNMFRAWSAV